MQEKKSYKTSDIDDLVTQTHESIKPYVKNYIPHITGNENVHEESMNYFE